MRILNVLPSLDQTHGGPVRLVMDLSAACLPLGLDSEVLGVGPVHLDDNPLSLDRIHALPGKGIESFAFSPEIEPWLEARLRDYDAVLLHGAWTYPVWRTARSCQKLGVPYGVFPHGMLEPWAVNGQGRLKAWKKKLYWRVRESQIYDNARCTFFTTARERDLSNRVFHFSRRQALLSVYGIDTKTKTTDSPSRSDLADLAGKRFALFLGRVHPKKNVDFLLRVWAAASLPRDWSLVIAGPPGGAYEGLLRRLAVDLGIADRVLFVGFVSGADKTFLLQRAEWFLLPSRQENFGVAVLEALANGCPVAISDQVYLSESFRDESEVMPLNLGSWTSFLRDRMPDRSWRDQTLTRDRQHLLQRFEASAVARDWARTLTAKLSPPPPC